MDSTGQERPVTGANSFPVLLKLVTSVFPLPTPGNILIQAGSLKNRRDGKGNQADLIKGILPEEKDLTLVFKAHKMPPGISETESH